MNILHSQPAITPVRTTRTTAVLAECGGERLPTTCLVCCGQEFEHIHRKRFPWLARCRSCGLAFADPQPDDAELEAIYDAQYYEPFGYLPGDEWDYRAMKQAGFARLLRVAETQFAPGSLLDVGSALGDLMVVAKRRGWEVRGVELNPFAVAQAERVLPCASFLGSLQDMPASQGSFDLITCLDVLEHLRRPDESLRRMHELLRPGGGLLIATIDAGGWLARLSGPRWVHFHRDHLWYFNRETLTRMVQAAGFEVLRWEVPPKVFNLRYIFGILAHHAKARLWKWIWAMGLRWLPNSLLSRHWPALPEGQLLLARKAP